MLRLEDCEYHHTENELGYRDYKEKKLIEPYKGKYGEGFKVHGFSTLVPFDHPVKYYIRKGA